MFWASIANLCDPSVHPNMPFDPAAITIVVGRRFSPFLFFLFPCLRSPRRKIGCLPACLTGCTRTYTGRGVSSRSLCLSVCLSVCVCLSPKKEQSSDLVLFPSFLTSSIHFVLSWTELASSEAQLKYVLYVRVRMGGGGSQASLSLFSLFSSYPAGRPTAMVPPRISYTTRERKSRAKNYNSQTFSLARQLRTTVLFHHPPTILRPIYPYVYNASTFLLS